MKKIILISAILFVTGCKTLISTDLYTSDLIAAAGGQNVTAPIVVSVEVSGANQCAELAPQLVTAFKPTNPTVEFIGCESEMFSNYARFRMQADIVIATEDMTLPLAPISIGVTEGITGDSHIYSVFYLANTLAIESLWQSLPEEITRYQSFEFMPVLSATFNNDLRGDVVVSGSNVFIDAIPYQNSTLQTLPRRDQIEIVLSDVANAAFGNMDASAFIIMFSAVP